VPVKKKNRSIKGTKVFTAEFREIAPYFSISLLNQMLKSETFWQDSIEIQETGILLRFLQRDM